MTLQVTIGFNPETLSAIADLAASIRGAIGGAAPAAKPAGAATTTSTTSTEDKGGEAVTIYWGNHAKATYGIVESDEAYNALRKKDAKLVKLTKAQYDKKLAEIAKAAEEAKKPAAGGYIPSEEDLIEAFSTYLPAEGLEEAEKKARRLIVKAIAKRFEAAKASEIPEEHRALAINLVQRVNAGQDIDVEDAEFEEFEADEDDGI
ncbi:MAG: hypothetical protein J6N20_20350 [Pseudomonas sp.]|nr:hypothetical protein [Pseudomonas sp.]